MKAWRVIGVFLTGLLTAVLIYPVLHESGHSAAVIFAGGKVCEFNIFPLPYITCDASEINLSGMIMIGISGMLFPLLLSWLIYMKNFWLWLIGLYLNYICLLSFLISLYVCVKYIAGKPMANEDITRVLELCPETGGVWIFVFTMLIAGIIVQVARSKPIQRCCTGL